MTAASEETGGLTVAVTGPTGEIGRPFMRALEAVPEVTRVLAMARRPFDPAAEGWRKAEYRRGDILDRAAVEDLVAGADVVVHLAFIVVKATKGSYDINIDGSRNVFEAAVAGGADRLVYTSSVAAYGYRDHAGRLTEDTPARGTDRHAYSHQKAEVERVLDEALLGGGTPAYVFRPCIVAGPDAPALVSNLPYVRAAEAMPGVLRGVLSALPLTKPVLPDFGIPFQLVHHDDVAAALIAAVVGTGPPGIYNLAAPGELTTADIARELGWRSVAVPKAALDIVAGAAARVPVEIAELQWLEALRAPMLMDCSRAERELGWRPAYDARATLRSVVEPYRGRTSTRS